MINSPPTTRDSLFASAKPDLIPESDKRGLQPTETYKSDYYQFRIRPGSKRFQAFSSPAKTAMLTSREPFFKFPGFLRQ